MGPRRTARAFPGPDGAVTIVIGPLGRSRSARSQHGPWSFVVDTPHPDREMAGPPPAFLAMAAWAACTTVTLTGVAQRSRLGLEDIAIEFDIETASPVHPTGFAVRKTICLIGEISEDAQLLLHQAADHCSLAQIFTKGSLEIEDRVIATEGGHLPVVVSSPVPTGEMVPNGSLKSIHLTSTKEFGEDGRLDEDGEVKIYLSCDNRSGPGRWALLAGHTSEGWTPPPAPLVFGALAGSSAATLQRYLGSTPFHIEIGTDDPPRGRDRAQADAAACVIGRRHIFRTVVVEGSLDRSQIDQLLSGLAADPVSRAIENQDVLVSEDFVVMKSQ